MESVPHRLRIKDLTGVAPWLEKNGIPIELEKEDSGRLVGYAPATPEVFRLMAEFQSGPTVDISDFLAFQRRLRGRLLDIRGDINGQRRKNYA